ncbi:hypothetical protein HMI54_013183, partial [Coelomomyces lativittatus]
MCLDNDGIIWITTYDGVLNRFDPNAKDKKYFRRITGTDALSRQSMFSILCNANNDLWIATASAILKYNISTNTFSAWKLKEQLPYDQYPGKKYIGKDGSIYFGGNKFYISFHPDSLHLNSDIPKVVISSFKIFNDAADDLLLNNEIKLKHDKNFFTFEFAALNFSNPAENKLHQQQLEKQKAVEHIRSKISMDIHDEIGSQLTKISLLSQRIKLSYHKQKEIDETLINKITESSKEV